MRVAGADEAGASDAGADAGATDAGATLAGATEAGAVVAVVPLHATETTAMVALAFAKARPQATEVEAANAWLLAHRSGDGWSPRKAKGAALAALAAEGTTTIHGAHHVHRGYENIERKFLDLGANITSSAEGTADTPS